MATPDPVPEPQEQAERRTPRGVAQMPHWEVALQSVSHLAVVFALSLALILVLAHQTLAHP